MRTAAFGSSLLLLDGASGEECKCAFDLVQLQDVTQTFTDDLVTMQSMVGPMMKAVGDAFPGSKYGFSVFADKPIPYSGFGDYATYSEWMIKDVCYQRVLPLTTSTFNAQMAIRSLLCSGGNDYAENQLGALVDLANDSGLGWSAPENSGGLPHRVKVVVMLTDALPHSMGDAKLSIDAWNDEWCLPTMNQFNIAWGGCAPDTQYFADCQRLGAQFREDPNSLTEEDTVAFGDVLNYCGPYPFPDPVPNTGKPGQSCIGTEYPSNEVMCKALIDASIFPVILTSGSNTDLMDYLHEIGTCPPDTHNEGECLARWYEDLFVACGIPGVFQPLSQIEFLPNIIIDALHAIEASVCRSPLEVDHPTEEPAKSVPQIVLGTTEPVAPEGGTDVPIVPETTPTIPVVPIDTIEEPTPIIPVVPIVTVEEPTPIIPVVPIVTIEEPTPIIPVVPIVTIEEPTPIIPFVPIVTIEGPTPIIPVVPIVTIEGPTPIIPVVPIVTIEAPTTTEVPASEVKTVYPTSTSTAFTSKSAPAGSTISTRTGGCHGGCNPGGCLCEGEIVMNVKDLEMLLQRLIRLSAKAN